MAHRSNQVAESQDRPPPQVVAPPTAETPPAPRLRRRRGWTSAGAALLSLTAGLWLARLPLGEAALRQTLAQSGLPSGFHLIQLDFSGATATDVRIGDPAQPDLAIERATFGWAWRGLRPQLAAARLVRPTLRVSVNPRGGVSAGALDGLRASGAGSSRRPALPRIRLQIEHGVALIQAPSGPLAARVSADGRIGRDFVLRAELPETTHPGQAFALDAARAELLVEAGAELATLRLTASARGGLWDGARIGPLALQANAEAPLDLASLRGRADINLAALNGEQTSLTGAIASIAGDIAFSETQLAPKSWDARAHLALARGAQRGMWLEGGRLEARLAGDAQTNEANWSFTAARAQALGIAATAPRANGRLAIAGADAFSGEANLSLAQASLTEKARHNLGNAFPNMRGAPIGPTFAQAEQALDAAARRFAIEIPLQISRAEGVTRFVAAGPLEARAATGARVRMEALRPDTEMLAMQWPGSALGGAAAVRLHGGGAPDATILFDRISWAPGLGFDADGTLDIADWRAGNARIAGEGIIVSIATPPGARGQLDLVGPVRIDGPLGDGRVRDMRVDLDVALQWGQGWRIAPRGPCLPVRLGQLDAVGLSFQGGAFNLCAGPGGALAAADARGRWSEGFSVARLDLNGRMAGDGAQPARLSAARVLGRFSGGGDDITLHIEAAEPALAVDMSEDRTVRVLGRSLTAMAHFGGGAWRVDGAFDLGRLDDPGLPGEVSAIRGAWSAAPKQSGGVVVRVDAAQAAVTGHAASAEDERPLFNPMRLSDVNATLEDGVINAQGLLLLNEQARNLARFTARHEVATSEGGATFTAERLDFGEHLQPYEISELARGVVDNVRGPASGTADIAWDGDRVSASGRVRLDGVSLAMATIPIIENVRGEVVFDDLFKLTTPPGQNVSVGLVNPGIAVENGRVRFQLLGEQRVAVESAEFDFASGVLALDPTIITLGADEANVRLLLRDVDATRLLSTLQLADLEATGTIEGSFPLRLARNTAYVTDGVLYAAPGGGDIRYVGHAGDGATGAARVAFEALKSFRYDDLRITLNGDISGEVVSSIQFSGRNAERPVDITELAPLPGGSRVTARGVPFAFNVTVTAPFRRLARTAAGFADPRSVIEEVTSAPQPPPPEELGAPVQ